MKLSVLLLAVSALVNSMAAAISSKVVVPSLRLAGSIKQDGLERAFFEHDKAYWTRVEELDVANEYVAGMRSEVRALDTRRQHALRTLKKNQKERII